MLELQTYSPNQDISTILSQIPTDILQKTLLVRVMQDVENQKNATKKIIDTQDETLKQIDKLNTKNNDLQNNLSNHYQATSHIQKLAQSEDYVNKTNLGKNYRLKLSPQRITKLLKYAGVLQFHCNDPYQQCYLGENPLCVRTKFLTNDGHEGYTIHFHQTRTWNRVYNKLKKDEIYDDFMNCITVDELNNFIDSL